MQGIIESKYRLKIMNELLFSWNVFGTWSNESIILMHSCYVMSPFSFLSNELKCCNNIFKSTIYCSLTYYGLLIYGPVSILLFSAFKFYCSSSCWLIWVAKNAF